MALVKNLLRRSKVAKPSVEADEPEAETAGGEAPPVPQRTFGRKTILVAGGVAVVFLLALGGGIWFLFFAHSSSPSKSASGAPPPLVAPEVAFFDMPDTVVNIQSADGSPTYLKLSVTLELDRADERPGLQVLMPRLVDQFQSYLRELRVDDLRGSAGVFRLKEELLRRINVAAAPYSVRDVLLKEMIVQ